MSSSRVPRSSSSPPSFSPRCVVQPRSGARTPARSPTATADCFLFPVCGPLWAYTQSIRVMEVSDSDWPDTSECDHRKCQFLTDWKFRRKKFKSIRNLDNPGRGGRSTKFEVNRTTDDIKWVMIFGVPSVSSVHVELDGRLSSTTDRTDETTKSWVFPNVTW